MFSKFNEESRKVLIDSKKEMAELKHPYIGSEHLILSILKNSGYKVTKILNKNGINYDNFKRELLKVIGVGKVDAVGSVVVYPKETTTYRLMVTDAFGAKEHSLKIQMLPLPHVKTFNIPTPDFNTSLNVNFTIPAPELNTRFPDMEVMGVELKAPFVPSHLVL